MTRRRNQQLKATMKDSVRWEDGVELEENKTDGRHRSSEFGHAQEVANYKWYKMGSLVLSLNATTLWFALSQFRPTHHDADCGPPT